MRGGSLRVFYVDIEKADRETKISGRRELVSNKRPFLLAEGEM